MAGKPIEVAYYYRIKWGYHEEFIELFKKNHYPILKAQTRDRPHPGNPDLRCRSSMATGEAIGTSLTCWSTAIGRHWQPRATRKSPRRLYPDQETFRREEQRRFELVEAHWDVPLKEVAME